jgi:hypothetical protein
MASFGYIEADSAGYIIHHLIELEFLVSVNEKCFVNFD